MNSINKRHTDYSTQKRLFYSENILLMNIFMLLQIRCVVNKYTYLHTYTHAYEDIENLYMVYSLVNLNSVSGLGDFMFFKSLKTKDGCPTSLKNKYSPKGLR